VLDTGAAVAKQTAHVLTQKQIANSGPQAGREFFYTSDDPAAVTPVVRLLWPTTKIVVKQALV
jgi:glutamate racemase